jgi:hypothetical protein
MTTLSAKTMLFLLRAKLQLPQHRDELVQQLVTHLLRVVITKCTFDGEINSLIKEAETRRKFEQQHEDTVTIDAAFEEVLRLRERALR